MRLTIERDQFLDAVLPAFPRTKVAAQIRPLKHLLLEASGTMLTVTGNDLDACCICSAEAEIEREGSAAVPADQLVPLLKQFRSNSHVELDQDGTIVRLKCGPSKYSLPTIPSEDMPKFAAMENAHSIELSGEEIARLLDRVSPAVSQDISRQYLTGVYLHSIAGNLAACATDASNLLRTSVGKPINGARAVTVPRFILAEFVKLGKSGGTLSWTDRLISLKAGNCILTSKLIGEQFPADYERNSPANLDTYLEFDRDQLLEAIERLKIVCNQNNIVMTWTSNPETVTIEASHAGDEEVQCDAVGIQKSGAIRLHAARISDMLSVFGGDRIRFAINRNDRPFRLIDPKEPDLLAITCPMQTGAQ